MSTSLFIIYNYEMVYTTKEVDLVRHDGVGEESSAVRILLEEVGRHRRHQQRFLVRSFDGKTDQLRLKWHNNHQF